MGCFDVATAAKYLLIVVVGLLVLSPCIAILWKGTNLRRSLWRVGCWRWVICCDRIYGEGVSSADFVERQNGALTVVAYYQLAFGEREEERRSAPGLRLETWRESLHSLAPTEPARLEEIKIMDERMERVEPLVLPQPVAADVDVEAKQRTLSESCEYVPPPVVLTTSAARIQSREETAEDKKSDSIV